MARQKQRSDDPEWPVTWEAVEEEQLKTWLRATPAQRLAWAEELLALARAVKPTGKPGKSGNKDNQS